MTTYHLGFDIAGTMRQSDEDLDGALSTDGRPLTGKEVRHYLFNIRQKNPALKLFTGDCCNNQGADGGCLGHPDNEDSAA